jgi:hypothetical protein
VIREELEGPESQNFFRYAGLSLLILVLGTAKFRGSVRQDQAS